MNWRSVLLVAIGSSLVCLTTGADWPQWRGPNRDGKVAGFTAPKTWPKELTKKWKVTVGDGVATPALVGDKLYVFARQDGNEITRCLEAATGKEVWQDKYESGGATGPASGFSGPRCSPTVVDGKVITLGVRGKLSCLDAASGKVLWRNETKGLPRFFVSSSPIVVDGLVISQSGGESAGNIVAYDLASGKEKWTTGGETTAYASPVLLTLGNDKIIVAETAKSIVGVEVGNGKVLWQTPFGGGGRMTYNASTPMVEGDTVVFSGGGQGTKAVKLEKQGDKVAGTDLWSNKGTGVKFNTPVLKDGMVYGITDNSNLFCIDAKSGKTLWTASAGGAAPTTAAVPPGGAGGRGGRGGRGGMGGRDAGYGSVVDAGSVLLALAPNAQLIVFEPNGKEFKKIASYKVAEGKTFAYPVLSDKRIYVKDQDSVILWTIE